MTETTAYQKWYKEHKLTLSERRKKRYREDPVYRQKCLDQKAKQTAANKPSPVDPQYTHTQAQAAEAVDVSLWTLRNWRTKGYIPEPHEHNKGLYFTTAQVGLLAMLKAKFNDIGKNILNDAEKAEIQSLSDLIRANWS